MNIFAKIWNWLKKLKTRKGLDVFLKSWIDFAIVEARRLQEVNDNQDFHLWKDQLFESIRRRTGELKGTWISILIHLAYEQLKSED